MLGMNKLKGKRPAEALSPLSYISLLTPFQGIGQLILHAAKHFPLLLHNIPLWSKIWDAVTHQSVIPLKDSDKECFTRQLSCMCRNQGTLLKKQLV